ncbi:hypothetical protein J1N35_037474, partial [Gossypium stocksii]
FAIMLAKIEEAKDIITLRLDELIGSLKTFEMNLIEAKWNKVKQIMAIKVQNTVVSNKKSIKTMEEIKEQIALLSKTFNKTFKCFAKKKMVFDDLKE